MAILDKVHKIIPRIKTAAGYIQYAFRAKDVRMEDNTDLETKITEINNNLINLNGNNFIRMEVISLTVNVAAAKITGVYSTPTPPDKFELIAAIPTNTGSSSCTWATCKAQSDGTVYVAMRNWTTSAVSIHPEYTAIYFKK